MSNAKQLLLLRHAKSSWDEPGLADHDRPLATRGRKAAKRLGAQLRSDQTSVDLVLCSREGTVEAHARDGACGFTPEGLVWERGRNPLANQDPGAFAPLAAKGWLGAATGISSTPPTLMRSMPGIFTCKGPVIPT